MNKIDMREWVASLEGALDNKLQKWAKHPKIENGGSVHLGWQFEQTHMFLYIFWKDNNEMVKFKYLSPEDTHGHNRCGLNDETFNMVMDRTGNYAQIAMYRPPDHGING